MNSLSLIGRLTRDPETRFTQGGKAITSFSVAYDVGWGERKRAVFLDCKLWGERGETLTTLVRKGHRIALVGALDQEEWADKNTGEKKSKFVLEVRDFTLIERKSQDGEQKHEGDGRPEPKRKLPPRREEPEGGEIIGNDDDSSIPF